MLGKTTEKKYPFIIEIFLALAFPAAVLVLWEIGAEMGVINKYLLPAPSSLWEQFLKDLLLGKIGKNLFASFTRVIAGFFIGLTGGIVIGFFMGLIKPINKILSSITSFFRAIPVIALVPLFILLFGIGESSKYAIIAYASFWPILLNTIGGIRNVDVKLCEVAYTYRIPKKKTVFKVILPAALPTILTGIRLGVSSSWMSVIAAEMFGSSRGIGYLITVSKDNALTCPMLVYIFIIGAIGLTVDKILINVQNFYIRKTRGVE